MIALLRTSPDGEITHANAVALEIFGDCVGTSCHLAVHAKSGDGVSICTPTCAQESCEGSKQPRDSRGVDVEGRRGRLICGSVDTDLHVTVILDDIPASSENRLSPREREVLSLVARGLTSREIGELLTIRPATVRGHVERARTKLDATTRAEAVARAIESDQIT